MADQPIIFTTNNLIDRVPQNLPVTCLRRTETGLWRLKTATEYGVHQTDFDPEKDGQGELNTVREAMEAYKNLPVMAVGAVVICWDDDDFFMGLEDLILKLVYPKGFTLKPIDELVFPWSTKPRAN